MLLFMSLIFIQMVRLMLKRLLTVFMSVFYIFPFTSLAVHPDKITIATGQVAGTSSDGKVSEAVHLYFIILAFKFKYSYFN